ncbi:MAG: tetraether lipid synthase Tes [Promethearchaeota archaeon]
MIDYKTTSICPHCLKTIPAHVFERDGKVWITKTCKDCGEDFEDIYWSDAQSYIQFEKMQTPGLGIETDIEPNKGCPQDCGLCTEHQTRTVLAVMDLTNNCNFRCPVCFANATKAGYLYEPSFEQIEAMLHSLRAQRPWPVENILLSGGEPTLHPRIFDILRLTEKLDFTWRAAATNGLKIARSLDFTMQLKEAGMNSVYLQFDGLTPEVYKKFRGFNALNIKKKAIEHCREADLLVVLVPTVIRGVNDDQIGAIIDFAFENIDIIRAVNFQPVAFTGRISKSELQENRITIPDLMKLSEEQTNGKIKAENWHPIPFITPFEKMIGALWNINTPITSVNSHCGAGAYLFKKGGTYTPIDNFGDVHLAREIIVKELERHEKRGWAKSMRTKIALLRQANRAINWKEVPEYFALKQILKTQLLKNQTTVTSDELRRNFLFIGSMHFMDPYNFDTSRVQKCCIHYIVPDGRTIPFCSYNSIHRPEIEKKYQIPFDATVIDQNEEIMEAETGEEAATEHKISTKLA